MCFVCDWIHIGNYFLFLFCPEETLKRTEPNADGSCRGELTCDSHGVLVEFSGLVSLDDSMSQISLQTQQDRREGSGFWDGIRYSQGYQVPVTYQKHFVISQEKEIKFVS